jgi:hypothetical protein
MYTREELLKQVDSLANGVDPITGEVLDKDSILNRSDIIRLLYSIRDYISEYGPKIHKAEKVDFCLNNFEGIIESRTTVSKFVKKINKINNSENMRPLSYKVINAWLLKEGYLELNDNDKKVPTKKGEELGLSIEHRHSPYGVPYSVVIFNENVQMFLLDKLKE